MLALFDARFRKRRLVPDLELHSALGSALRLSAVEKDFLLDTDERALLVYLCSAHYLRRRNQRSSSILRMFDFNSHSQEIDFHGILNQRNSGFARVPSFPMNVCFARGSALPSPRLQFSEFDLPKVSKFQSESVFFSKAKRGKINNTKNFQAKPINPVPLQSALNLINFEQMHSTAALVSLFISPVQALRHNPFPVRWTREPRKLKEVPWLQAKYQIEFPTIHSLISESSKLRTLDNLLRKLKLAKHRVLIFCQMTKMMNIIEDYLQFRKYKYYRLDGGSGINERRDMVDGFQNCNDVFVFLLSTRAGGLGVTLTAADDVIFYDNDWNPTMDAQAEDRAHRIGSLDNPRATQGRVHLQAGHQEHD